MAKQTEFEQPPKGHIGLLSYDPESDKWYAVLGDDAGHILLEVTTIALPDGAATALKQLPDGHAVTIDNVSLAVTGAFYPGTQPVSVVALPLPSDAATQTTVAGIQAVIGALVSPDTGTITKRLENILTELEAKLETSDLNIDGAKDLQIDVKTMPTTVVQAAGGNKIWSLKGPLYKKVTNTNLSTGTNNLDTDDVDANEIWVVTHIAYRYVGTPPSSMVVQIEHDGDFYEVTGEPSVESGIWYDRQNHWILDVDDYIRLAIFDATATDNAYLRISGYIMDAP